MEAGEKNQQRTAEVNGLMEEVAKQLEAIKGLKRRVSQKNKGVQPGTILLKVALASKTYRILAVPSQVTLYALARAITQHFGFYFDHCFGFYNNPRNWTKATEGYEFFADIEEESDWPGVKKTKAGAVFDAAGKEMLFLFDYGDEWHFRVDVLRIDPPGGTTTITLMESSGKAPQQY